MSSNVLGSGTQVYGMPGLGSKYTRTADRSDHANRMFVKRAGGPRRIDHRASAYANEHASAVFA